MGAWLFHADGETDGQTDTMKLLIASSNFANAPKNMCKRKSRGTKVSDSYREVEERMIRSHRIAKQMQQKRCILPDVRNVETSGTKYTN